MKTHVNGLDIILYYWVPFYIQQYENIKTNAKIIYLILKIYMIQVSYTVTVIEIHRS